MEKKVANWFTVLVRKREMNIATAVTIVVIIPNQLNNTTEIEKRQLQCAGARLKINFNYLP